jgi:hypothetical protein
MEYKVSLAGSLPDATRLAALLEAEDPAAVADLDAAAKVWRVNTSLGSLALVSMLGIVGCPTPLSQVSLLPSTCCGGCSG